MGRLSGRDEQDLDLERRDRELDGGEIELRVVQVVEHVAVVLEVWKDSVVVEDVVVVIGRLG